MFGHSQRILVAVSGGKDSLGLWDLLLRLGYRATGLYLGLGIGEYSDRSGRLAGTSPRTAAPTWSRWTSATSTGSTSPPPAGRSRSTCAVCGLSKRYVFNRAAVEGGFDVVATGHNLDDEAATLLGNTLRWETESIARQYPVLPAREGMVHKVKPLYRLSELETAAYAFIRQIDYVVEECPLIARNTQLRHKEVMNTLERVSPGTKAQFFLGYVDRERAVPPGRVHRGARHGAAHGVRVVRAAHHRSVLRVLPGPGPDHSGSGSTSTRPGATLTVDHRAVPAR